MNSTDSTIAEPASTDLSLGDFAAALLMRWRLVLGAPLLASVLGLGASYLIKPTFTSRTSFLPPQQQQGAAGGALASLGALAGLAGGGIRNTGDQYLVFVQSRTVADRMIDRFKLEDLYEAKTRDDARLELAGNTRVSLGKKDGVILLEVDDHDPKRAAQMTSAYVEELRRLTAGLALTEAQQRRIFFEGQLKEVRMNLEAAQTALQESGVSVGSIRAEPKATAESLAKLQAQLTAAIVRLSVLRRGLADQAPEVLQQLTVIEGLRAAISHQGENNGGPQSSYIASYREYKYQEALFELMARQYELAKVDESRDGGQLQMIDVAQVPERKSKPKRSLIMIGAFALTFICVCIWIGMQLSSNRRRRRAAP